VIDFFDRTCPVSRRSSVCAASGRRLHGVGDIKAYNAGMAAVEYAIEHDDGQSSRALNKADVILLAPSRCGKTPTTMYLALQHGVFVANYPLVPEDLEATELPRPVRKLQDRCFGITTTPARLTQVRQERRPSSRYASLEKCG
jgi:regulator of PEP synthase PpsR (kinase-PPPase family)